MILAVIALALQLRATSAVDRCIAGHRATRANVFVTIVRAVPADTMLRVAVCYVGGSPLPALGSYHGRVFFDSANVRVLGLEKLSGGVRAENVAKPGVIDFAGASGSGFASGPLLAVRLRVPRGYRPTLQLEMVEANAVTKETLLPKLKIIGRTAPAAADSAKLPGLSTAGCPGQSAAAALQRPTLVRLVPATVPFDSLTVGAVVTVEIEGCGFDQNRNVIRLKGSVVAEVPSTSERTRVHFSLPAQLVTGGEVPPMRMGPGAYTVTVTTGLGTSNSLTLLVR